MLYVCGADITPVANRVPTAPHWGIYRRVLRESPALVTAMYEQISQMVSSRRYIDPDGRFPNSSWLGSEILGDFPLIAEWNAACGDRASSSALFGQIMWTVLYDDADDWCTTTTATSENDREERVYWRLRR
jgi:hypothetical protein